MKNGVSIRLDAWTGPGLVVLIVLAFLWAWWADVGTWLAPESLSLWIEERGLFGPLLLMLVMVLAVIVGPIPTIPITMTAGLVWGVWMGTLYAAAGALVGALLAFWIARKAGRKLIARMIGGHVTYCRDCSDTMLFGVVLGARLIPIVSFAFVSYGAGLTAMSARAFAIATLIGMVPMTIVYTGFGAVITTGPLPLVIAGMICVMLMLFLPWAIEHYNPFGIRRFFPHLRQQSKPDNNQNPGIRQKT